PVPPETAEFRTRCNWRIPPFYLSLLFGLAQTLKMQNKMVHRLFAGRDGRSTGLDQREAGARRSNFAALSALANFGPFFGPTNVCTISSRFPSRRIAQSQTVFYYLVRLPNDKSMVTISVGFDNDVGHASSSSR